MNININSLPSIITKKRRRLGQGHGSGRVKTAGRGTKGQNARSKRSLKFEGGALPLTKRLPYLRGKGRNKAHVKQIVINLSELNKFAAKSVVSLEGLVEKKIVRADEAQARGVKILGEGELKVALTIRLPISKQAKAKVEKAGGVVSL